MVTPMGSVSELFPFSSSEISSDCDANGWWVSAFALVMIESYGRLSIVVREDSRLCGLANTLTDAGRLMNASWRAFSLYSHFSLTEEMRVATSKV